jgi:hypothetical protein
LDSDFYGEIHPHRDVVRAIGVEDFHLLHALGRSLMVQVLIEFPHTDLVQV